MDERSSDKAGDEGAPVRDQEYGDDRLQACEGVTQLSYTGQDPCPTIEAIFELHRRLFLENNDNICDITRDCLRDFSRIQEGHIQDGFYQESASRPYQAAYLEKLLVKVQPTRAVLRNTFRQVLGFITQQNRVFFPATISYLLSFINELRVARSTSGHEDKKLLKTLATEPAINIWDAMTEDASSLLYWSCIEVARYCLSENNISKDIDANGFLQLLDNELSNCGESDEKYSRKYYVMFVNTLERALIYDLETSLRRSSFVSSTLSQKKNIPYNQSLYNWIVSNRERVAKLSSKINDPAQCWRNIDITLANDLAARQKCTSSLKGDRMPLNTPDSHNQLKNLSLITEAAMQLNDPDLLYGIKSLSKSGDLIHFPSLGPMISNLEGHFEQTHKDLKDKCNGLDEQSLNKFLEACVELDDLEGVAANLHLLQSDCLINSYRKLIQPVDVGRLSLKEKFQETLQWVGTWSDSRDSLKTDLMMSAFFKTISRAPQGLLPPALRIEAEWFIGQDFIAQTLFSPSQVNSNFKIYNVLFEMLKMKDEDKQLPVDRVKIHSKNLRWNSVLFRHICDLNWLNILRQQGDKLIDSVQYRAIKYHRECQNTLTAVKLSNDLIKTGICYKSKIQCSLLMKIEPPFNRDKFEDILHEIELSTLEEIDKNDLKSKALRLFLRSSIGQSAELSVPEAAYEAKGTSQKTSDDTAYLKWGDTKFSSRDTSITWISSLIKQLDSSPSSTQQTTNKAFGLDLELLRLLNQDKKVKSKSSAVECAVRILRRIREHHSKLDQGDIQSFTRREFLEKTTQTWILVKSNLISMISAQESGLSLAWRRALAEVLKVIVSLHPHVLLYSIIANCLENKYGKKVATTTRLDGGDIPTSSLQPDDQIDLWSELYVCMTSQANDPAWLPMLQETKGFVEEMRRISYLPGENLHELSETIRRRLARLSDYLRKRITLREGNSPTPGVEVECRARLSSICEHAIRQIDVLTLFSEESNSDSYNAWFKLVLKDKLDSLRCNMSSLSPTQSNAISLEEMSDCLERVSPNIIKLLDECQRTVSNYSNKLWMHLISPRLSRLKESQIPMPGFGSDSQVNRRTTVTIFKVSQIIEVILSKTRPKRLALVGSDGKSRSFLLKAFEDLRHDEQLMDLFSVINNLFSGRKETRQICRLRSFTVTPISTKSGLIEWVEAPSLAKVYRDWLTSSGGRSIIKDLYGSTCRMVCRTSDNLRVSQLKIHDHPNCQVPQDIHYSDIYYQLVWAKAIGTNSQSELIQQRPSRENLSKYRATFGPDLFQEVIEHLTHLVPNDLIASSLWLKSINAFSYWRKTKQFTHSCATASMVGYMIGLGDRHLDNILLDFNTGEVVHIDLSLCFELSQVMKIPERVPFRLTHNLTRAFGFAGLEGGFTRTSCKVLDLLKEHKTTLLHLLDLPINWFFMLAPQNAGKTFNPKSPLDAIIEGVANQSSAAGVSQNEDMAPEKLSGGPNDSLAGAFNTSGQLQLGSVDYDDTNHQKPLLNDLQINMPTPTTLFEGTAKKYSQRICEKLSGADKQLIRAVAGSSPPESAMEDVEHQTTNEQVATLIREATSLENKAAMYQGWTAWV